MHLATLRIMRICNANWIINQQPLLVPMRRHWQSTNRPGMFCCGLADHPTGGGTRAISKTMKKKIFNGCRTQGDWQLEVALIDLHIRQLQAVINQLKTQRREIIGNHLKKRRRWKWQDDTPMIRIVNLPQLDSYNTMMDKWKSLTTETINPSKTCQFIFKPDKQSQAILALARVLEHDPPVFKVGISELCRYLSTHSNLGTPESIRRAIYRIQKKLWQNFKSDSSLAGSPIYRAFQAGDTLTKAVTRISLNSCRIERVAVTL